ncbi:MAG TPA: STAS domain-containing protein [Pseudonocardia sp.]|jgi:anti-anti-sigma factor
MAGEGTVGTVGTSAVDWTACWLRTRYSGEDAVVVEVSGGIAAERADDLWDAIEGALEQAAGRPVVVDLTEVTGFDEGTVAALTLVARATVRRHHDLCALVRPHSALEQYLRCAGVTRLLPLFVSVRAALAGLDTAPAREFVA